MHHDQMKRLLIRALAHGAKRVSQSRFEWDVAGRCQSPVARELHVRPADETDPAKRKLYAFIDEIKRLFGEATVTRDTRDRDARKTYNKHVVIKPGTEFSLTLTMSVACRKCEHCRKRRQRMWSNRAKAETLAARRTWFGTLTLRPEAHAVMVARAQVRLARSGVSFELLSFGEQFLERHKECSIEITKYLKRVRKESGAKFRYLLVAEHHQNGLPHYHVLVHERDDVGVKHRTLSSQWQLGFEKWRVVTDYRQATYLCKYLSKATVARVRASGAYGTAVGHSPQGGVKNDSPKRKTLWGLTTERVDHDLGSELQEISAGSVQGARHSTAL